MSTYEAAGPGTQDMLELLLAFAAQSAAPDSRPNVVLVMTDDQGYGDAGYRGHRRLATPNLDAMAASGVRFDRFYAAAPVCSPTRGSCLTGRHPYRYGIRGANVGHLPAGEHTLAEILRARGYRTGHFGKWHLGTLTKTVRDSNRGGARNPQHYAPPWEHGFDECFSTEAKVPTYDPMVTPAPVSGGTGGKRQGAPYGTYYWTGPDARVEDGLDGDDSTLIMERAIPFIERSVAADRPFLAVIWFHAPHLPIVAGAADRAAYAGQPLETQHYYGCLAAVDRQVGRLRTKLRELGVARDTMLWFCSDNGPEGRDGRAPGSTAGLRGRKRALYDGGVRVPGLLEWPARAAARVVTAPCSTLDYVPTVLDALGERPALPLDGISLLPLIDGRRTERDSPIGFEHGRRSAWLDGRYKLLRSQPRDGPVRHELYDLKRDRAERDDLTDQQPARAREMAAELAAWRESCAASAAGADYSRPNVLLIMADDLGTEWLSCYGGEELETPHIDALANDGLKFVNAYSMPKCTPTRATLLTGQYPFRHGWVNHWDVPRWGAGCHFDPEHNQTFAEVVRDAGYATAIAGKWQINDFRVQPNVLDAHGFDEWCMWTGYETDNPPSAKRYWNPYLHTNDGSKTHDGRFGTDVFVDFLVEFVQRERERPWLAYFPMCLPHGPLVPTPRDPEVEGKQPRHAAMVRYVDDAVGRLVKAIDDSGQRENTIVIFTTDNGSARGVSAKRGGVTIRGGKGKLDESGCNAPLIVRGAGVPSNRTTTALTDFTDLFPTLADLARASVPAAANLDGESIAPLLRGHAEDGERRWIMAMGGGTARIDGDRVVPAKARADRVIRDRRYKLWLVDGEPVKLFDLARDPLEQRNLIEVREPAIVAALTKLEAVNASFPARDASPRYDPTPAQPWDRKRRR